MKKVLALFIALSFIATIVVADDGWTPRVNQNRSGNQYSGKTVRIMDDPWGPRMNRNPGGGQNNGKTVRFMDDVWTPRSAVHSFEQLLKRIMLMFS